MLGPRLRGAEILISGKLPATPAREERAGQGASLPRLWAGLHAVDGAKLPPRVWNLRTESEAADAPNADADAGAGPAGPAGAASALVVVLLLSPPERALAAVRLGLEQPDGHVLAGVTMGERPIAFPFLSFVIFLFFCI